MKKKFLSIVLASSILAVGAFADAKSDVLNKIQNITFIKKAGFKVLKVKKEGSTYVVKATHPRMPQAMLFVAGDLKTVAIGTGFTAKGQQIQFLTNMKQFKKQAIYTTGKGKKDYYMFTDAECPFCQQFERAMKYLKKDVKLHVYLFPLSFHPHSISMSKYILSLKTDAQRAKAMEDIANGDKSYVNAKYSDAQNKEYKKIIADSTALGNKLGVRGTPTVYDEAGHSINWPTLLDKGWQKGSKK